MLEEEDQDLDATDLVECLAYLEVESLDDGRNQEIPLYPRQEIVVGRDDSKCYVISDGRVSKQHFRLYSIIYEEGMVPAFPPLIYCQDLESFNGTYVNGKLIGKITHEKIGHLLEDGDVIYIQPFWKFRFHQAIEQLPSRDKSLCEDLKVFRERFEVSGRLLGQGKYGNVYLATEINSEKQIACKIVDLKLAMENLQEFDAPRTAGARWASRYANEQKKRVLREIRILAKLSHPNIINLKKAFCSENALYIFTELSTGGDLFSYLQSHGGRLNEYNSRFIMRQITLAIQFLHSNNIAHRDIKPENVLVSHTFFGGRVVLTDFGFAIHVNPGNTDTGDGTGSRRMRSKIGTGGYVAPEVANESDDRSYTVAADMWSLGLLVVCLITGESVIPHQQQSGMSPVDVAALYLGQDDSYANEQWERLQSRACRFIQNLLQENPEQRMTADQALDHSWFTKPAAEAAAMNEGLERVNKFWRKRGPEEEILEGIRGVSLAPTSSLDPSIAKWRKKVPEVSFSPYFGLDRHLTPRAPSTRKRLLDDLSQSGSAFLHSKEPRLSHDLLPFGRRMIIEPVNGNNIFRQPLSNSDEVNLVPDTPTYETQYGISFSDELDRLTSPISVPNNSPTMSITMPAREESGKKEGLGQLELDNITKASPRYTSAQDLRDKMKTMTMNGGRAVPLRSMR